MVMIEAAKAGQSHIVALLLDRGADVHFLNDPALYVAVLIGHDLETVRLLLDRGADLHAAHDALPVAAEHGFIDLCILLLDRGADMDAQVGRALRMARLNGHTAIVALLLERGAIEEE